MARYSPEQIETLRQLRASLLLLSGYMESKPFGTFGLRPSRRKHLLEFVFVQPHGNEVFNTAAVVRLYRGKVRIQFFYANTWPRIVTRALVKEFGERVQFAEKPIWGHRELLSSGPARTWKEYADPEQIKSFI
ncbi:MAG: hypothetical protein HY455_00945 [Parcubacteria group bacterium]|nr:hypothetical protein [Parcubacteria group bacterium]